MSDPAAMPRALREHQADTMFRLRRSLAGGSMRPMVQAPTGFGKTVLMSHIVLGALARGNGVAIVVPSISLIDQTVESLQADGVHDIGVIQADHPMTDYRCMVQVCSVQSLQNRDLRHPDLMHLKLVLIDEAHRWFKFYESWMGSWTAIRFVGLSATPWTKGLGKYYDDLIIGATTQELIDKGWLSPFRVFAPTHPDLSGVKVVRGDYHEGQLADAMNRGALVADIVSTWLQRGEGRPTLAFAVDRAHAKHIQRQFEEAGVSCGYVDAYTTREERQEIANKFHSGAFQVVANVGCLTTGVDWDVRCIILARPTKSEMLFVQIIGRGLRIAEGKADCLILDHSDTHLRLGFVTDIEHTSLDMGTHRESPERVRDEPLPKECGKCHFLKPPKVHVCPACGFAPERQSEVEEVDGELEEMIPKAQRKLNRVTAPEQKAEFYGGLKHYAAIKGYKPGWAANKYREKFGVWPNSYSDVPPCEPNPEVRNFIKHLNIKYARRKAA